MKKYQIKNLILFTSIILLLTLSLRSYNNVNGAAGDDWGNNPVLPIDPNNNEYSQCIRFKLYNSTSFLYNTTVEINPVFEDYTCLRDSLRIVYENSSGTWQELAFQNTSQYINYSSSFLQTVNMSFVVPQIGNASKSFSNLRLYWSFNDSIAAPGYGISDMVNLNAKNVTYFHTFADGFSETIDIEFSGPSNNVLTTFYLKKPSSGYQNTIEYTNFNYEGQPDLAETSEFQSINLGGDFIGKGPVSIKTIDGSSSGWTGNALDTFLIVGSYKGVHVYKHTAGQNQFTNVDNYTVGISKNCTGLAIGNVLGDGDYDIVVGCENGSSIVLGFDGTSITHLDTFNNTEDDGYGRKAYGIAIGHFNVNASAIRDDIVVASAAKNDAPYHGYFSIYNESFLEPGDMKKNWIPNVKINSYYTETTGTTARHWAPNMYIDNFIHNDQNDGEEILIASRSTTGHLVLMFGSAVVNDKTNNPYDGITVMDTDWLSEDPHETHDVTSPLWYGHLVGPLGLNEMTALATSTKLNDNTNFSIITAQSGVVSWYNVTYQTGEKIKLTGGSDLADYRHNFGTGAGALLPITGNFDNYETTYDDVVLGSSNGRIYFMKYDTNKDNLVYLYDKEIAPGVDFTGNGQSMLGMNISGNAAEEVIIAGNDGIIRILNYTFPSDVEIDVAEYGDIDSQIAGNFIYNQQSCTNFVSDLNTYISGTPIIDTILGEDYYVIPIDVTSGSRGRISLSNLDIGYKTNDYDLMDKNVGIVSFTTDLTDPLFHLENFDNDKDHFPDVYEFRNMTDSSIRIYTDNIGNYYTLSAESPLPVDYILDPTNNDSDGDGVLDGDELKLYYTHPNKADSDGDTLTDWYELFGPNSGILGPTCVVLYDSDGDSLNDAIEIANNGLPLNTDSDGDTLSDSDEYHIYKSHLNEVDSDGDGILDVVEALDAGKILHNVIFEEIRHYKWNNANGLNLTNADTDGDGISDFDEIFGYTAYHWSNGSQIKYFTDPTIADLDEDGVNDGEEINGRSISYINWTLVDDEYEYSLIVVPAMRTNPQNNDTDNDGVSDLLESPYFCNPLVADTDRDGLLDGVEVYNLLRYEGDVIELNATNPDTDGDILLDGVEYYGIGYRVGIGSNPTVIDTDGDGWDDYREVMIEFTDPSNSDSDGDGVIDSEDKFPMMNIIWILGVYSLVAIGFVASIASYPINKKAAKVASRSKIEYKKKIDGITNRLERERATADRVVAFARMMPSNLETGKINVKVSLKIVDKSFYCRQSKIWYSAGADEFREAVMDKVDDMNFAVVLANIPLDMTVLYYFELLDKGGVWLKQLKDEEEQKTYEFSTGKDGVKEVKDWEDDNLVKCEVCGYMCRTEWDDCPECNTPLHDTTQEIFIDDQTSKEEKRKLESDPDEIAWKEAQQTDEIWRGLPECPNCGFTVQPDWSACPVCSFDLTAVKLEAKAVYEDLETDMDYVTDGEKTHETYKDDTGRLKSAKDEKKAQEEEIKKKKKAEADEWGSGDGDRDVL